MAKVGRQTVHVKVGRKPAWINDTANQAAWNGRFIGILARDYGNSDSTISGILSDKKRTRNCALKIRSYVDKKVSFWLYQLSKARGAKYKKQFEIAIAGIQAATSLYRERGNEPVATYLHRLAIQLSGEQERCKSAFATKRHGRDRAHSTLSECRSYLEEQLGKPVTFVTLANLVNAGHEADGNILKDPITEEHIRKNLAAFVRNNPLWRNKIDPLFKLPPNDPATK